MRFDRYINSGEIEINIHVTKSKPELSGMKMTELKELLNKNNIPFKSNLSKSQLIELVTENL